MKRLYPRFLTVIIIFAILFLGFSFAEDPDAFLVQVEPSSFWVWEAVDVTISAVKNGMIVKDYIWDVFIEVDGLMPDDYIVPSDWLYSFLTQDQGIKLFSKWLEIKKSWTYTLKVSDIIDDAIKWEMTVIIWWWHDAWDLKTINISSPIAWWTEKQSTINVMWSSPELGNSPIEVYINNISAGSGYTDAQWNFNIYISGLQPWENEIQAKIMDITDIVLGSSDVITVTYVSASDGIFKSIEVLPNSDLKQWDKVTFNVYTAEEVTSVELSFSDGKTFPLDRLSPGVFNKDIVLSSKGSIDVSLSLIAWWNTKNYDKISNLNIAENNSVNGVRFHSVWVDWTSVTVSREPIDNAPKYRISYGTDRNSLQKTVDVNSTQVLIENLQKDTIYYFQILPLDMSLNAAGNASEIVEYNPKDVYSSCVVKWITLSSEKIWDKYYLTRDTVDNTTKYEIYKSEWEDMSQKKKVWESTGTMFEYPFNRYAEQDEYAYYEVQAICSDGTNVTLENVKKVKVWPFENTILIIIITLFLYSIYRLYRTVD